ncbi:MAG: NUDIX domain-containing protein [Traorella sp.]
MVDYKDYLGKIMNMKITKPIGFVDNMIYPINYGYLDHIGVYLLGIDMPVSEYQGQIIGIIYHLDDDEVQLVMAPQDIIFTQKEIAEQIQFKEKNHRIKIDAIYQKSCGAVLYKKENGMIKILCLYQRRSQSYSMPKGRMEAFESEKQTAKREIKEEVGISVDFISSFREVIEYDLSASKRKKVILFLAECKEEINININEIEKAYWLTLEEANGVLPSFYSSVIEKIKKTGL